MSRYKTATTYFIILLMLGCATSAATLQTQLISTNAAPNDQDRMNVTSGRVWSDLTGNGNHAQGPAHTSSGRYNVDGEHFGGADFIDLSPQQWYMTGTASVPADAWGFTTIMVANIDKHPARRTIISLGNSTSNTAYDYLDFAPDGKNLILGYRSNQIHHESTTTGQDFSGADHIFTAVYRSASDLELFVDGRPTLTYRGAPGSMLELDRYGLGATGDQIGRNRSDSDINFEIAEVRIYAAALSAKERKAIESSLADRYYVDIPEPTTLALLFASSAMLYTITKKW